MAELYKFEHVGKRFSGPENLEIFKDINLSVEEGESLAIVGTSGSGKSTLLHLMGALDTPSSGKIFFDGRDMSGMTPDEKARFRNRTLGFVFQFHHLLPEFSALDNVAMPLMIRREKRERAHETAMEILTRVGLAERVSHVPGELSGGERQRVALARALVTHPACVLADEPTGNLDGSTAQQIFDMMLDLSTSLKTSFVIVTHDMELAERCDRIVRMSEKSLQKV